MPSNFPYDWPTYPPPQSGADSLWNLFPLLGGGEFDDGLFRNRNRNQAAGGGMGGFDWSSLFGGGASGGTLQNTLMMLQLLRGGGTTEDDSVGNLFSGIST